MPDLAAAIEALYLAFAAEPEPRRLEACPCCLTPADIRGLLDTPLRSLSAEQLREYVWSVFHTVGDVGDFRYLLPRILELVVHDRHAVAVPDREVVLKKLPLAGWHTWPAHERAAVAGVVRAAFEVGVRSVADDPAAVLAIDGWLCGWGLAGGDVEPLLDLLSRPGHEAALLALHKRNRPEIYSGRLHGAFWDQDCAAAARVVAWFESEPIQEIIERLDEQERGWP